MKTLYTEKYDKLFNEIKFYQQYPQMKPWVGGSFSSAEKKLLILGESHYLPKHIKYHKNPELWYKSDSNFLIKNDNSKYEAIGWIDTRGVIDYSYLNNYNLKGHTIFKNINNSFNIAVRNNENKNIFQHIAYYNYFLRPAENTGGSIKIHKMDKDISNNLLMSVIQILQPTHILFLSTKSWDNCSKKHNDSNIIYDFSCHPTSNWWNRKSNRYKFNGHGNKLTGKEKFIKFLKHYEIFN